MRAACSSCVPCDAFIRKIETPCASISRSTSGESLAWPSVTTILVFDTVAGYHVHSDIMPLYQAVVLAIIQGITEFLPISSTAHLALAPWLLGWKDAGLTFDIALHVGTLVAVGLFFFRDWLQVIAQGFGLSYGSDAQLKQNRMLLWFLAVASIPVGVIGFIFKEQAEEWRNPFLIGGVLI